MKRKWFGDDKGVTLLELTFAMAVFAVALGATAQVLISYYVALDVQQRRATALEHCRSVLGALREIRDAATDDFVEDALAWIDTQEASGGEYNYTEIFSGMEGEAVTTTCSELYTGGAPADPLLVVVTSAFEDALGRPVTVELESILTRSL